MTLGPSLHLPETQFPLLHNGQQCLPGGVGAQKAAQGARLSVAAAEEAPTCEREGSGAAYRLSGGSWLPISALFAFCSLQEKLRSVTGRRRPEGGQDMRGVLGTPSRLPHGGVHTSQLRKCFDPQKCFDFPVFP